MDDMNKTIKEIAERLIGRSLNAEDGINASKIEEAEKSLGIKLPNALKDFYLCVGNTEMFASAFQYFVKVDEFKIKGDKLIFLEENQGVCYWAINSSTNDDQMVYVCDNLESDEVEWYPESRSIDDFLKVIMYLQCAEGGYKHGAVVQKESFADNEEFEIFLRETTLDWEKVVDHNGFVVYQKDDKLIWYFSNESGEIQDMIFASTRIAESIKELGQCGFMLI